jgi:OOP family OmpA-OmpF porin
LKTTTRSIALLLLLGAACGRHESTNASATSGTAGASSSGSTTVVTQTTPSAAATSENLASLAAGATVAVKAPALSDPYYMLDDDDRTGWVTDHHNEPVVIELADRSLIKSLGFRTKNDEIDSRYPKDLLIEISDAGPDSGFQTLADLHLPAEALDGKSFPVSGSATGRWLRLTPKSAQSGEIVQIMDFLAFGDRLTHNAAPDVTGSWDFNASSRFEIKQEGSAVAGCINDKTFFGGIEGRVIKFVADFGANGNGKGPAVLVISGDGKRLAGGWWRADSTVVEHPTIALLEATKKSDTPETCAAWKAKDPLEAELEEQKRVRLYGINFDIDSDQIQAESKPTLDKLATILKMKGDWKIIVEGHTDSTATPEHNQDLSARRAESVKSYLNNTGVDNSRLTAKGLGATQPIATNDTSLGRAQNRRVEIVRE